jgi:CheY-like chemotaxis protein
MTPQIRKALFRYGIAIDLVIFATGVALLFHRLPAMGLAFIYGAAILLSVWRGGWRGVATATAGSLLAMAFAFTRVPPLSTFMIVAALGAVIALGDSVVRRHEEEPADSLPEAVPVVDQQPAVAERELSWTGEPSNVVVFDRLSRDGRGNVATALAHDDEPEPQPEPTPTRHDPRSKKKKARAEAARLEAERLQAARAEAARLETVRFEAEREEAARLESERLKAERAEAARIETVRIEAEREEAARLESERLEAERVEAERLQAERAAAARIEAERIEAERLDAARIEAERLVALQLEEEQREAQRLVEQRLAEERAALQLRLDAELEERRRSEEARLAAERAEEEQRLAQQLAAERLAEEQRLAAGRAEQERLIQVERERVRVAEQERLESEHRQAEAALQQQLAEERETLRRKIEAEAEAERLELERMASERLASEREAMHARVEAQLAEAASQREKLERETAERLAEERRLAEAELTARIEAERAALRRRMDEQLEAERAKLEEEERGRRQVAAATAARANVTETPTVASLPENAAALMPIAAAVPAAPAASMSAAAAAAAASGEKQISEAAASVVANAPVTSAVMPMTPTSVPVSVPLGQRIAGIFGSMFHRAPKQVRTSSRNVAVNVKGAKRPAAPANATASRKPAVKGRPGAARPRLLMLEKRRGTADTVVPRMRQKGIEVQIVERWIDAVDEIFRFRPDALLIDSELPDFEKIYRSVTENNTNLPLFITRRAGQTTIPAVRYAGLITRPYEADDLIRLANEVARDSTSYLALQQLSGGVTPRATAASKPPAPTSTQRPAANGAANAAPRAAAPARPASAPMAAPPPQASPARSQASHSHESEPPLPLEIAFDVMDDELAISSDVFRPDAAFGASMIASAPLDLHAPGTTTDDTGGAVIHVDAHMPTVDEPYVVACFNCRSDFDAMDSDWCSCLVKDRTLLCTNCLTCFCKAPPSYREKFWVEAPPRLFERKAAEVRRQQAQLPANPRADSVQRPLVLLVEDDEEIQVIVHRICSNLGYGFIGALNGQDGMSIAREYQPDLILSDAFMPKLDGREMCRLLRDEPFGANCRMIVMTGLYTDTKYKSEAIKRFHVDDYVSKPVAVTELIALLQRHLEGVSGSPVEESSVAEEEATESSDSTELMERDGNSLADFLDEPETTSAQSVAFEILPAKRESDSYEVCCFNCAELFDATHAEWCTCLGRDQTLLCPHCHQCFCKAPSVYKERFWMDAPSSLFERKMIGSKRSVGARLSPAAHELKRPLILLVEDDENIQLIVKTVVTSLGYGFIVAANGQEGLGMAREYNPDLILSDAFMPKLDGREMCRLLKLDPATARTKAIIMTGLYTDRKYRNEALDYFKVDDYVAKPLAVDDLIKLFKKHLPQEVQTMM